jgi:hypothetical protein
MEYRRPSPGSDISRPLRAISRQSAPGRALLAVQREEVPHQEEQHERQCQRHRDPHVVFHRTRTLVHLAGARTPLTGVEYSTESLRFVTRPPGEVISPGSRGVDTDPGRFSRRNPHRRISIQSSVPSAASRATSCHSAAFCCCHRRPRSGSTVAKALIRSEPNHTEGVAMIAATAFAAIGLVVVAFLNRIP